MNKAFSLIVVAVLALGAFLFWSANAVPDVNPLGEKVVVYKTPECGCCAVYVEYLKRLGVEVEEVNLSDLTPIKKEYGVSIDISSCHTSVVGGYVVEGHVPIEVVQKLLSERPDLKGIALPGMPSGTPGMPGPKLGDWIIYAIGLDGEVTEYMKI